MEDLVSEVAGEIEAFSAQIGLHIMQAEMEHEVSEKVGVWGQECPHSVLLLNPDPDLSFPKLILPPLLPLCSLGDVSKIVEIGVVLHLP